MAAKYLLDISGPWERESLPVIAAGISETGHLTSPGRAAPSTLPGT
jgi:hypothetical protein